MITIRASSLSALFDCPARWEATYIYGKRLPSNSKAILGKAIHASTAFFDQSNIDGHEIDADESAGIAVDTICTPNEDVNWEGENKNDLANIAVGLHKKYCNEIAQKFNYVAVEAECQKLEITDLGIAISGTTDRIYESDHGLAIADIKTGKSVVNTAGEVETKGHAFQIGVYEILAQHVIEKPITGPAKIIGLSTGKTSRGQHAGIGEILEARNVLVGDDDSPGVLEHAANIIKSGAFFGNPKSMFCHKNYCANYEICKFRK